MARTDTLGNFLTDVAEAIRNKKGTTDTIKASDFDTEIASLPSGGGADLNDYFKTEVEEKNWNSTGDYFAKQLIKDIPPITISSNVTNLMYLFSSLTCNKSPEVITTDSITTISYMFSGARCNEIGNLDRVNTSNVINIMYLFENSSIKSLIFPRWDFTKITQWQYLCKGCTKLEYADLTNMDMTKPSNNSACTNIFEGDYLLKTIIYPSQIATTGATSTRILRNHWRSCYSLIKIVIPCETGVVPLYDNTQFDTCYHFTGTTNATYNPDGLKDGKIYVPDNLVDSYKTTQYWSTYADCIFPISDLDN